MATEPFMDLSSRQGACERHSNNLGIPTQLFNRGFPTGIEGDKGDGSPLFKTIM